MGCLSNCTSYIDMCDIRKGIEAHYRKRGVPETKISTMVYRWLATKGWRIPK